MQTVRESATLLTARTLMGQDGSDDARRDPRESNSAADEFSWRPYRVLPVAVRVPPGLAAARRVLDGWSKKRLLPEDVVRPWIHRFVRSIPMRTSRWDEAEGPVTYEPSSAGPMHYA